MMPQLDIVKEFFVVHTPEVAHPNRKNAVPSSEASLEVNHGVQSDIPEREFQVIDELPVIKTVNSGTNLPVNPGTDLSENPEVQPEREKNADTSYSPTLVVQDPNHKRESSIEGSSSAGRISQQNFSQIVHPITQGYAPTGDMQRDLHTSRRGGCNPDLN